MNAFTTRKSIWAKNKLVIVLQFDYVMKLVSYRPNLKMFETTAVLGNIDSSVKFRNALRHTTRPTGYACISCH